LLERSETLLRVRLALHTTTGRPGDVLHLQDQFTVARKAGFDGDDQLMAAIAQVGRRVMCITDEAWSRFDPPRAARRATAIAPGVSLTDGEMHLDDDTDPTAAPTLVLRVAAAAARSGARIDRDSLDRLGRFSREWPSQWPGGCERRSRGVFVGR